MAGFYSAVDTLLRPNRSLAAENERPRYRQTFSIVLVGSGIRRFALRLRNNFVRVKKRQRRDPRLDRALGCLNIEHGAGLS